MKKFGEEKFRIKIDAALIFGFDHTENSFLSLNSSFQIFFKNLNQSLKIQKYNTKIIFANTIQTPALSRVTSLADEPIPEDDEES